MSKAPRATPTERIAGEDWDPGEYAVVKTYLGFLEHIALAEHGANTVAGLVAQVLAGVEEWHITYADGTEVPLSEEGVRSLERRYIQHILLRLNAFWAAWNAPAGDKKPGESEAAAAKRATFRAAGDDQPGARRSAQRRESHA